MMPLCDLIEWALAAGYIVEAVSSRHIELVTSEGQHRTTITVESSNLTPELLAKLLQAVKRA